MSEPSAISEPTTINEPPTVKRIYISGISSQLTGDEIEEKLQRFGTLIKPFEFSYDFQNNQRNFGFLSLELDLNQWKRCISALNNTQWKGSHIKIQEAKPSTLERITAERTQSESGEPEKKVRKRILIEHAKDMNTITKENYQQHQEWKKLKYDKLIRKLKIRNPYGNIINYDPVKYQANFKVFRDMWYNPNSISTLDWNDVPDPIPSYNQSESDDDTDSSSESDSDSSGSQIYDQLSAEIEGEDGFEVDHDDPKLSDEELPAQDESDFTPQASNIQLDHQSTNEVSHTGNNIESMQSTELVNQPSESDFKPTSTLSKVTQQSVTPAPEVPTVQKPKSKIDLLIDSIINEPQHSKPEVPKRTIKRKVTKPKAPAQDTPFQFNFSFGQDP